MEADGCLFLLCGRTAAGRPPTASDTLGDWTGQTCPHRLYFASGRGPSGDFFSGWMLSNRLNFVWMDPSIRTHNAPLLGAGWTPPFFFLERSEHIHSLSLDLVAKSHCGWYLVHGARCALWTNYDCLEYCTFVLCTPTVRNPSPAAWVVGHSHWTFTTARL